MRAILIVDDDAMSRMFVEMVVRKTGADVLKADNGLKAVEKVKEGHEILVIVMDMSMPVMDGYEATKIIKSYKQDIPVIALTSLNKEQQKQKMIEAGCDIILNKPVAKKELQNAIIKSLNKQEYNRSKGHHA